MPAMLARTLVVVAVILLCAGCFLAGTVLGFNMAIKRLSECQEVPCATIEQAINATHPAICESCLGDRYRWLIVR